MYEEKYLIHYRTPGSKNGVRKYQNEDGTLTRAGELRYLKYKGMGRPVQKEYDQPKSSNHNIGRTILTNWPGKVGTVSRSIYTATDDIKKYWDSRSQYEHPTKQTITGKVIKKGYDIYKPVKKEYDKAIYISGREINKGISDIDKKMRDSNTFIGACATELLPDLFNDQNKINDGTDYLNQINDYLNTPLLGIYDFGKYIWNKSIETTKESHKYDQQKKNPANLMLFGDNRPRVHMKK